MMYTLGPIGLSVLILGYGFVLAPLKMAMKGVSSKLPYLKRVSTAIKRVSTENQSIDRTTNAGRPARRVYAATNHFLKEKDINKTKEAAMSAFLALTYLVFPGSSLQILKGLATDVRFDNDPEYNKDWQTGKGGPQNMCRLLYDCKCDAIVVASPPRSA